MTKRKILASIGLLLGMGISTMMQTLLTTSMPVISNEFGSVQYYSWVYGSYMLASSATIPLFGQISERFGYRKNYILGGALFIIGILSGSMSQSMLALIMSRVIMGLGSGMVIPATYGLISRIYKKEQMKKVFAFIVIFQIFNNGIGSVLGGVFSTYLTWRVGLLVLVPFEALAVLTVFFAVSEADSAADKKGSVNIASAMLLFVSLVAIMYSLEQISVSGSPPFILLCLFGITLMLIFIIRERRISNGVLPREILNSKRLIGYLVQVLVVGAVMNSCFAYLPRYMTSVFLWQPDQVSVVLLVYILSMGIASVVSAVIKVDSKRLIVSAWILIISGSGLGSIMPMNVILFIMICIAVGLGTGILSSIVFGEMQQEITTADAGVNGIAHLMRNIGGTIGVSVLHIAMMFGMQRLFAGLLILAIAALAAQTGLVMKGR